MLAWENLDLIYSLPNVKLDIWSNEWIVDNGWSIVIGYLLSGESMINYWDDVAILCDLAILN
jgi:hypothetical protein